MSWVRTGSPIADIDQASDLGHGTAGVRVTTFDLGQRTSKFSSGRKVPESAETGRRLARVLSTEAAALVRICGNIT